MTKCVVIGGNGFIGSHLVDELVARGHEVTAFDRFSAARKVYTSEGVRQVIGNFENHADVREALAGQDHVFHFLSTTTPATSENDPTLDVRTNVAASVEMLEIAVQEGISKVSFASTGGAMYGMQPAGMITEDALPLPVSPYAIGKLSIEGYLRYFQAKHGLDSVSFRISNPYGPRQGPNKKQGVIPIFLQSIAEGRAITVYGDGSMVRDYMYVGDVARQVAQTVGRPTTHPVYNIGSGVGHSVSDIVEVMREITGKNIEINHRSVPATFIDKVVLDVARYDDEFGGGGLVTLREGVALTWSDTLQTSAAPSGNRSPLPG